MSYCRWSSDDFGCDVFVADCYGGWTTHVAWGRHTNPVGPIPKTPHEWWTEEAVAAREAQRKWLDAAVVIPIGLPHDGKSFNDETPGECANRLEKLRALGYNVPQYAIDVLRKEQGEQDDK